MTGKQLKNSILQWAIQGKLVPQDPNDEPASVLLEKIRQEKERLIKEKKIKRDKNASIIYRGEDNSYYEKFLATGEVKCIDEEIPFEVPKGWEWCRLGNISSVYGGKRIPAGRKLSTSDTGHKYIRVSDMKNSSVLLDNIQYVSEDIYQLIKAYTISKDDLYITVAGTIGSVGEIPEELDNANLTENADKIVFTIIDKRFLMYALQSELVQSQIKECTTKVGQPKLAIMRIQGFLIALPPLNEQKRIVGAIEVVMPSVSKYEQAQIALEKLNTGLNEKIRKSVLQEAIQGKLVPQIAEEGTAQELLEQIKTEKQKLVKECKLKKSALSDSVIFKGDDNKYYEQVGKQSIDITEEIPFEIPSSWQWVRLEHICSYIQRGKSPKYSPIKQYPVVAQKCNQWTGFTIEKAQFIDPTTIESYTQERFLEDGDLMWNSTGLGTLGRMAIYWEKLNPYKVAVADSHVTVIRPLKSFVIPQYLFSYFSSYTVQSVIEDKADGSTKQKELATTTVKRYLVPFPPLAEQKRIVEKIKEVTSIMRI